MFELTTSWEEAGLARGREEGLSRGREEGLSRGREEGLSRGREEGLRLVTRQLHRRLGPPPREAGAGLSALSPEQLEDLAVALLDFSAWSEVTNWLKGRAG